MNAMTIFCTLAELRDQLAPLINRHFSVSTRIAGQLYNGVVNKHFARCHNDVHFVIEYPYVDRVYRDSYYGYFSTKMTNYKRDCIRLSLFQGEVTPDQFRENKVVADLQTRYLGYMVLRPTIPNIVGRNMISPNALQNHHFLCLTATASVTAFGVKLTADGFPHSAQDTETISCAETSVWATMEYFASRYSDYKPALPSTIIEVLRERFNVRQLPSEGLNMEQMAFALKQFGFGTKIYAASQFGARGFSRLLSCYVESGIPILPGLYNDNPVDRIGHAVIMMGRSYITDAEVDALPASTEDIQQIRNLLTVQGVTIYDNDDIDKEYVIIDDNYPAYQMAKFGNPAHYYNDPNWARCRITHFVVPIHTKVYLDAFQAKIHIKMLFLRSGFTIPDGTAVFLRVFLASSRSYKDYLTQTAGMQLDVRDFILGSPMPKFIWVGELSDKILIKQKRAQGVIILGATEPNVSTYKALVFAGFRDQQFYADPDNKELKQILLPLGTFSIYSDNLKGF
jgi:hypothetical protein